MDEESLQSSIDTYKQQLQQVETVLQSAGTEGQSDLLQLQKDLQEVIALTEESLLSLKKSKLLSFVDDVSQSGSHSVPPSSNVSAAMETRQTESSTPNMDDEFAAFQAALADDLSGDSSNNQITENTSTKSSHYNSRQITNRSDAEDDDRPSDVDEGYKDDIAGTQCSVFVTQEWGTRQCHNAIVLSVEPAEADSEEEDEIKVRVLFCNPTTKAMLPCPYFLEDKCRFSQDECKWSHGHVVSLSDLNEFKEHDYSLLTIESQCLARYSDNIWYPAVIEFIEEDHQYLVRFQSYGTSETVGLDRIIPVAQRNDDDDESSDDSESDSAPSGSVSRHDSENETNEEDGKAAPSVAWQPTGASSALGEWEAHTRGIGSKIMAKMGYEFGKGLGKDGQGRRDIVEAVVYPQGRSLDKCMELREQQKVAIVGKKRKRKGKGHQGKGHQGKSGEHKKKGWTNVFDIINRKLGGKKVKMNELIQHSIELSKPGQKSKDLSKNTTRNLNVQLVKVQEEIRNTSKKVVKLKDTLTRNQGDAVTSNQVRAKILEMEHYLQTLHNSEKRIQQQQNTRDQHKKLTIF
ncbi:zinc finger CCCH-type with G patch domain-containing protein-like [Amphiura filiformis]|uniref:zinc finger CCCH-type with G patch domain-containing protein-like n=1 Tax=Amphiura filiformis TaxID=82378 RepID=UPI003B220ADA